MLFLLRYYGPIMARPLRIEHPGAVYHITSRGKEKKTVFKDDQDRETSLNIEISAMVRMAITL